MQDALQRRTVLAHAKLQPVEIKPGVLLEPGDEDPFAMLWNIPRRINDPRADVVAELVLESSNNRAERVAPIVAGQVLNIFKQKSCRAMVLENSQHLEKQGALRLVHEPVFAPQRIQLRTHRQ